jgi:hypothetical protein
LIFHTTRMLKYSVGCCYLKAAVIKCSGTFGSIST